MLWIILIIKWINCMYDMFAIQASTFSNCTIPCLNQTIFSTPVIRLALNLAPTSINNLLGYTCPMFHVHFSSVGNSINFFIDQIMQYDMHSATFPIWTNQINFMVENICFPFILIFILFISILYI